MIDDKKKIGLKIKESADFLHKDSSRNVLQALTSQNQYNWTPINDNRWITYNMKDICKQIDQWEVQKLYLYKNRHPIIIVQLSSIKSIQTLNQLNLQKNLIQTLQPMTRIHLPSLTKLYLKQNNLTNLSSFRKIDCNFLNTLQINFNRFNTTQGMSQLHNKQLKILKIDCLGADITKRWNDGEKMKWQTKKLTDVGRTATYKSLNIQEGRFMMAKLYFDKINQIASKKYKNIKVWIMK